MYLLDYNALKSHVVLSRSMYSFEEATDHDKVTFYLKICLSIIEHVINAKTRQFEDEFIVHVESVYNDPHVFEMGQFLIPIIKDIKMDFSMKGHDPRLYYKLRELKRGVYTQYIIQMDLERTFVDFKPYEEKESIDEMVSEHPDQDVINRLLETQIHPGR